MWWQCIPPVCCSTVVDVARNGGRQPSSPLTRVTSPSYIVQRSSEASGVQGARLPLTSTTVEQHRRHRATSVHPAAVGCASCGTVHSHPVKHRPLRAGVLVVLVHSPPSPSLRATLNRVRRAAAHPTRCWCWCDAAYRYAWWCRLSLRWEAIGWLSVWAALCSGHS